jgi:hypothetical protein
MPGQAYQSPPVRCLTASDLAQAGTQTGMTIRGLVTKPS